MRCTEWGFWLEFPADPERWASCRSPSASPPPPAPGVLSLLLLYYMGIVRRLLFLCNLFSSYLLIYFCTLFAHFYCIRFLCAIFHFLVLFSLYISLLFWLGKAVSLCFMWRSDTILLMWCNSNAEGWLFGYFIKKRKKKHQSYGEIESKLANFIW